MYREGSSSLQWKSLAGVVIVIGKHCCLANVTRKLEKMAVIIVERQDGRTYKISHTNIMVWFLSLNS